MTFNIYSLYKRARLIGPVLFLFLALSVLIPSCATMPADLAPAKTHLIAGVPFYAQEKDRCGPASLAGVMNYWKIRVSPAEISKTIFSESARGTLDVDMIVFPQKRGLRTEQYSGGMTDLRKKIDNGYPLVVLVDYGFWVYQREHYMVIVGYDDKGIIANSGTVSGKFIPENDFVKAWEKTNFWTLLIKPERENEQ
jgi:ABC-type bacteriocin/lantibiotic exporter with double-glycine peptidase domain